MNNKSAWVAVFRYLHDIGTTLAFGIPNDDLEALHGLTSNHIRLILTRDQRNAVFMAAGYALAGQRLGVCVVGKGPALTNAITGLLESASSSAPILLLGTGTAADRLGTKAFQEADQISLARTTTKWAYRVEHPDRLLWAIETAVFLATNGNPGPVYIEIPEKLEWHGPAMSAPAIAPAVLRARPLAADADAVLNRLAAARRPLFLIGGGARNGASQGHFEQLAERVGAAMFVSASGRGAIDERHALFCGLAGLYTAKPLRRLWADADLIVVFGSRMEETATLLMDSTLAHQQIVQVDIDVANFSHRYRTVKLSGDAAETASGWAAQLSDRPVAANEWTADIAGIKQVVLRQKQDLLARCAQVSQVHVAQILAAMEEVVPADSVIVQENGLIDMWSYFFPYFGLKSGQRSLVPSEQTTLGFGTAAALGAKLALPDAMVVAFVGDGAFNMYRADLFCAADHAAAVTYIVLDNRSFGWLEYQARCSEMAASPFRFRGETSVLHPAVVTLRVSDSTQIHGALVEARRLNGAGKTVIVEASIAGMEPAPGIEDFYGRVEEDGKPIPSA